MHRGVFPHSLSVEGGKRKTFYGKTRKEVQQGNRILCSEDFAEVVLTPTRFESLGFGATLGGVFVLEQVQGHMPQDREVLWTKIFAHATMIFVKSDIEHPVNAIFNPPMSTHR